MPPLPRKSTSLFALLALAASVLTCSPLAGARAPVAGQAGGQSAPSRIPASEPLVILSTKAIRLQTQSTAMLGGALAFRGRASSHLVHKWIAIEGYDQVRGRWIVLTTATVSREHTFLATWRTSLLGRLLIRATMLTGRGASDVASIEDTASALITIYRPALATYFGHGFFGQRTACGQQLSPLSVGLAHRTLPCGTLVEVSYHGQRLVMPVIDRGPYANGADWDLTEGAALILGINETVRLGAIVVGKLPNLPTLGEPQTPAALTVTGGSAAA
jgi:rare lipoprotein A